MSARLARIADVPLNSGFGVTITRAVTAGAISESDDLRFYIDLVGGGVDGRVILDETSATISGGGYTVRFSKDATWSAANLSEGVYHCFLFVNGTYDSGCVFETFTPPAGEANPLTDVAT